MRTDDVDWSRLSTAYGAATEVPSMLSRLHAADADVRAEALSDLWGCLCHQETVYDASAAAAGHLLDAAQSAPLSSSERHEVMALLTCIGRGADSCWDGCTSWETVQHCAAAVEDLLPEVVAWARTGNPEASTWTVVLAAYFPARFRALDPVPTDLLVRPSAEITSLVLRLVDGVDPEARLVTTVAARDEETLEWLQEGLAGHPPSRQAREVLWDLATKDLL